MLPPSRPPPDRTLCLLRAAPARQVRQFVKGTDGNWAGDFASALCGSPGLYAQTGAGESGDTGARGGGGRRAAGRPARLAPPRLPATIAPCWRKPLAPCASDHPSPLLGSP